MKSILLTATFFLSFIIPSIAQTDAQKAQIRVHITNANSALQSSNWDQALSNVSKAQEVLGSSAAIFESIRIKAYHGKKDYQKAKEHLLIFFQLNPADNLIDEIAPISADVDKNIEAEVAKKRQAVEKKRKIEEEKRRVEEEKLKRIQAENERELANRQKEEREKFEIAKEKEKLEEKLNKIRKLGIENGDKLFISEGLAAIKINSKWGFANSKGEIIIATKYDQVYSFNEGLASVNQNGKWYFINKEDQIIINLPTGYSARKFREGFAKISSYESYAKNGSFAIKFINKDGDIITKNTYDYASDFSENRAKVVKNDLAGFIDTNGHEVIPLIYFKAGVFSEGLAPVFIKNGIWKWGYIDSSGNTIIDFKYASISLFKDGLAKVEQNGETFQIDRTGKRIE